MIDSLKAPWPWYIAGAIIGLIVPLLLIIGNKTFGLSSNLRHICAACFPANIKFFKYNWKNEIWNLFFVVGIIIGAFIATHYLSNPNAIVINEKLKLVNMSSTFLSRNVNEGFSGGEKKRNEILQMILLESELSILDEMDSGLDIDALKVISTGINTFMDSNKAIILITHYQRLLDYIKPDYVHVMQNGKIIKTGNADLAKELEIKGYEWLK